ncbi:MBL fold metallo-hydrolase [Lutimaribacter sp. EGI FJ00015]|uniref:MBL fold metallo-hydrolase n=1 Tax=Lutimaribacter degradans TaxID=2945989 RepID=A0ACC5ZT98_9RHOB|nr:MBL fold metallo-hydrolase [Lutimaribacter sp. EGI FJ00013]MCM2561559.1 MBL fold metallo-hydrolase [Lutimaribacter sp. EGI FJ00013]MCO0612730.1 MBL fold metallo-hydrolase [Lutimaribacter sp. EGI FJ00015]MCO0635388.1 MBL fold metallo-hydrolase [Lutimaribacter sp. EGI FJ00014]
MDGAGHGIRYPWDEAPQTGLAREVAEGVLWLRLPLPMALDHVNIYALDEGDSWTIVDTGVKTRKSVTMWEDILNGPLRGKPVGRVILTHYHPDHVGMVGWLMERFGAENWTSRTTYSYARMLMLDTEETPSPQAQQFWRDAGMAPEIYQKRMDERPFNLSDMSHMLPTGFVRLQQGDTVTAAGRTWDVHVGNGHAPEHLTLWSREDNLVLAGDQMLPSISPNIGVHPAEPLADPLAEWLESCARLAPLAREDHLVLGGHKLPFTGLPLRMHQLAENHHGALRRLRAHLEVPRVAGECFPPLFKRQIDAGTYGLALSETVAHLNHLLHLGEVTRQRREDGAWLWHLAQGG